MKKLVWHLIPAIVAVLLVLPTNPSVAAGDKEDKNFRFERTSVQAWASFKKTEAQITDSMQVSVYASSDTNDLKGGTGTKGLQVNAGLGTFHEDAKTWKEVRVYAIVVPQEAVTVIEEASGLTVSVDLDLRTVPAGYVWVQHCGSNLGNECLPGTIDDLDDPVIRFKWEMTNASPASGRGRGEYRTDTGDRFTTRLMFLEGPAASGGVVLGTSNQGFDPKGEGGGWISKSTTTGTAPADINYQPPAIGFFGVSTGKG